MSELLTAMERLFGGRVVVFAILILVLYFVAQAVLKLFATLRDNNSLHNRLSALKLHYEIRHLASQTRALNRESKLPDDPQLESLDEVLEQLVELHSQPDAPQALSAALAQEFRALAIRHRLVGVLLDLVAQFGRFWGSAFISYFLSIAFAGDDDQTQGANWDNIVIMSALILVGFWVSNAVVKSTIAAGVKDPIRSWSYALGATSAVVYAWAENVFF